jgi:hypothetical protein
MDEKLSKERFTLCDADISSQRSVTRRSLLGALGLGLGVAAATVVGAVRGSAQGRSGCTDSDTGRYQDAPGLGTRCRPGGSRPSGCTDTDSGRYEDAPGEGVHCRPSGRRPTGCKDEDSGPNEDPPGYGKRCWI